MVGLMFYRSNKDINTAYCMFANVNKIFTSRCKVCSWTRYSQLQLTGLLGEYTFTVWHTLNKNGLFN